ncbi:DUF2856 family protein [Salmonella enterica subsp. enterica]|nr:DUF2856 family protein [Salmonella enterica subsp. enterica]
MVRMARAAVPAIPSEVLDRDSEKRYDLIMSLLQETKEEGISPLYMAAEKRRTRARYQTSIRPFRKSHLHPIH